MLDDTDFSYTTNGHDPERDDGYYPKDVDVVALEQAVEVAKDVATRIAAFTPWAAAQRADGWPTTDIEHEAKKISDALDLPWKKVFEAIERGYEVHFGLTNIDYLQRVLGQAAAFEKRLKQKPEVGMASVLDDVHAFLGRFIVFPSVAAHIAVALWIFHTHLMRVWETTPRLAVLSAELESGKSRVLEVMMTLVPKPIWAVNVSANYLFRKFGEAGEDEQPPTILYDEVDAVFGPKAKGDHEDIRALLNAGYRKGAVAGRCVVNGKKVGTEDIPAYGAVALAGIGDLPSTIMSRAVIIRMKRRAAHERIEPWRQRIHTKEGESLRDRIEAWAQIAMDNVTWPQLPPSVDDRQGDIWEPLIAVAEAVGGEWPERAREAAVFLVKQSRGGAESLGVLLLKDIEKVFPKDDANVGTKGLLALLHALDESPWSDLKGKPLAPRGLAKLLKEYGIESKQVRVGEWTGKGYEREHFHDAWSRYVSDPKSTSETESETDLGKATKHAKQGNRGVLTG
jgi:hypothetical protein